MTTFNVADPEVSVTSPPGTVLMAYRGSIAHGMYVPKNDPNHIDDIDLIGVVIGEPRHYIGLGEWGSRGTKEIKQGHYDCVFYEIRKAFSLLLQGNPNILSLLWTRHTEHLLVEPAGRLILENRGLFLGKHVYNSFAGYASAQLMKMEKRDPAELREYLAVTAELKHRGAHPNHKGEQFLTPNREDGIARDVANWGVERLLSRLAHFQKKGENIGYMGDKRKQLVLEHGYDAKNAAHCIRLLKMGKEFLETGEMQVYRTADREELLDIKAGKWPLSRVKEYAEALFADIKVARDASLLPEEPNRVGAELLLIGILRHALCG